MKPPDRSERGRPQLPMLTFGQITVCDERPRLDIDTEGREFSVTIDNVTGESSWGEFFSREDAEKLRDWLAEALQANPEQKPDEITQSILGTETPPNPLPSTPPPGFAIYEDSVRRES